jgi:hypothetical protein
VVERNISAEIMSGYVHPLYAASLTEFGEPYELLHSKGWILKRQIPGFPQRDAMACYPFFSCLNWPALIDDCRDMAESKSLLCLSLVTDPFADLNEEYLRDCFGDVVFPFKEHYVIDLSRSRESFVSKHHRRNALKAGRSLDVVHCQNPKEHLDQWCEFYQRLIERHQIKGITVFSRISFEKQMEVPGMLMLSAKYDDELVGMLLFYVQGDVAYYHLGAYCEAGYQLKASFALFWFAIEYFAANGPRWLNLGAGAGVSGDDTDGLSRFKRGWSTGTRTAYFCGRIFDHARYSEIVRAKGISATDYFPAYRKGEFG